MAFVKLSPIIMVSSTSDFQTFDLLHYEVICSMISYANSCQSPYPAMEMPPGAFYSRNTLIGQRQAQLLKEKPDVVYFEYMDNLQKGINHDTGFDPYGPDYTSRKAFDLHVVRREMNIIATDLQCTHVRITGSDLERLAVAAQLAVEAGLSVWFSPFPCNLTRDQLFSYFVACATLAENIRLIAPETVLVLGCELSLFDTGFLPGEHLLERSQAFTNFEKWQPAMDKSLNEIFANVLPDVRRAFHGSVTYAAGEWEETNWSVFDIVSIDLYRAQHNEAIYQQQLSAYGEYQKPVAITEFGCCALKGAALLGGNATFAVLSMQGGVLTVNEGWQYSDDPRHNLDMASYGIVQVRTQKGETYTDMNWEPRRAFEALSKSWL